MGQKRALDIVYFCSFCPLQKMAPFTKMTEMTPDNVVDYVDSFASEVILLLSRHASLPEKVLGNNCHLAIGL